MNLKIKKKMRINQKRKIQGKKIRKIICVKI